MQFHDAGLAIVESRKFLEPIVQCDQLSRPLGREDPGIVQGNGVLARAAFAGILPSRVSTRIRRMAWAAMATKCERLSYWG